MSAWKPTDEQIESMADQLFHERMPLHDWPPHNTQQADNWRLISRGHMASSAFQSIIRAAQAEALRDAARAWGSLTEHSDMYPGAHFRNEARGFAAVLARAMADAIDRSAS